MTGIEDKPERCDNCHREGMRRRNAQLFAREVEGSLRHGLDQDLWTRVGVDPGGAGVIDLSTQSANVVQKDRKEILGTDPCSLIYQKDLLYYRATRFTLTEERPVGSSVIRLAGGATFATFSIGTRFDDAGVREWLSVGIPVPTRYLPSIETQQQIIRGYLCRECELTPLCILSQRLIEMSRGADELRARLNIS